MPSITLRSLRKRLGYLRGYLTPEGAVRLGVKPGEVHYLPAKRSMVKGRAVEAAHVYRGARIAGHVSLGPDGILPWGS